MSADLTYFGNDMAGRVKAWLCIEGKQEREFSLSSAWLHEMSPPINDEGGVLSYLKRPHTGDFCVIPLDIDCSSYILLERHGDCWGAPWW